MKTTPLWEIHGKTTAGRQFVLRVRARDHAAAVERATRGSLHCAPLRVESCVIYDESPEATRRRAAASWAHFQNRAGSL